MYFADKLSALQKKWVEYLPDYHLVKILKFTVSNNLGGTYA